MKRVAVYCGANPGKNPIYTQAAINVADWLAQHHFRPCLWWWRSWVNECIGRKSY